MLMYLQTARLLLKMCWHPQWQTPYQCINKSYTQIWQLHKCFQQNTLKIQRWRVSFAHFNVKVLVYKIFLWGSAPTVRELHEGSVFQHRWWSVEQAQSFLALEAPDLSGTSWLCHTQGITAHRAQLVLKTRSAHHLHFRDLLAWEGLLPWLALGRYPGLTPIGKQAQPTCSWKLLNCFSPKTKAACALKDWSLALSRPCSWGWVGQLDSHMHYWPKLRQRHGNL